MTEIFTLIRDDLKYSFQNKDFVGWGWPNKGLSPPCCLPKIIILKAIVNHKIFGMVIALKLINNF